jgi:hypothetical protein
MANMGWASFWAIFFTQTHPVTLAVSQQLLLVSEFSLDQQLFEAYSSHGNEGKRLHLNRD